MPTYTGEDHLTEDLRIKVNPMMRSWIEQEAAITKRSINNVVRRIIEEAMRDRSQAQVGYGKDAENDRVCPRGDT